MQHISNATAPETVSLLTENEMADEFVASFNQRRLSEKFFYWFPLSVRAWLTLCSDGEYRDYVRSRSLIATRADELADAVQSDPLEVVSLGSGQGDKDAMLLAAIKSRGTNCTYTPVDTSQALLELACREGTSVDVPSRAIKADFTRPDHLSTLASETNGPRRLVMLLGNTLGAEDPIEFARTLAMWLRDGDFVLVDGELYSGEETLAGYDNPINRRFAWAPLHAVGIDDDDGQLVFVPTDDERGDGLHLISKHFEASREVEAAMGGEILRVSAGEQVAMNHSYKYSRDTFIALLRDAGLDLVWDGTSEDGRFLMTLSAK